MPEIAAPPAIGCSSLHSGSGIQETQPLGPDLFSSRAPAREGNGRFAKGHSGNRAGRPRGIPNPKRRLPDLRARPMSPDALLDFVGRKPWQRRPLLAQLLPPARAPDPAQRLGISVEKLRMAADFQQAMLTVWNCVSAGQIGPREAGRLARRLRTQMRAIRRLRRIQRRLADWREKPVRSRRRSDKMIATAIPNQGAATRREVAMGAQGIVVQPGEGLRSSNTPGREFALKLLCRETGDSIMMFEETVPAGTKSTFHLHRDSDEVAYVLEGEVTFLIGDDVTVGGPGACAFMPRDVPHAWKSTGAETGRVLFLYTPAKAGGLIEEQHRIQRNFSAMTEQERTAMLQRHGWELLGPSPL